MAAKVTAWAMYVSKYFILSSVRYTKLQGIRISQLRNWSHKQEHGNMGQNHRQKVVNMRALLLCVRLYIHAGRSTSKFDNSRLIYSVQISGTWSGFGVAMVIADTNDLAA